MWADPAFRQKMAEAGGRNGRDVSRRIAAGELPELKAKRAAGLVKGRKANWSNPEYREKMRVASSTAMAKTNARRASGEFPEWDQNNRDANRQLLQEKWQSGEQHKLLRRRPDGFRSGLEAQFAARLESEGLAFEFEPQVFQIVVNGRLVTYTPDFYIPSLDWWVEVKGHWWDDARAKVDAFREQYPDLKFSVVGSKLKTMLGPEMHFGKPWGAR